MSKIIDRALDIINDRLKTQTSELSPTMEVRHGIPGMAHGGHVLEDDYPTHYLPDVGRQVMADGGMPAGRPDISQYLQQIQAQQAPMRQAPVVSDYAYTGAARPQGYEPNRPSWVAPGEYVQSFQGGSPTPYVYGQQQAAPTTRGQFDFGSILGMLFGGGRGFGRGYAEGGMPDDDDPVARALQTAQSVSQEPMPDMTPRPTTPSAPSAEGRVTAPKPTLGSMFENIPESAPWKGRIEEEANLPRVQVLTDAFNRAIERHANLPYKERVASTKDAIERIAPYVGMRKDGKPVPLLGKNAKLMKSEKGYGDEQPIEVDGMGVETTGLALAPAFKMGNFQTCPNHASCKDECLGKTSGNYFKLGGGQDLSDFQGPRLNSLNKTIAMLQDPEAFAVRLYDEIMSAKREAEYNGNKLGVRLNVLSDLSPKILEPIIKGHPEVDFYDYTKMGYDPVAENHHYTYSSTGVSDDEVKNPNSNWKKMRDRLDRGDNVAMAFTDKEHLPEEVHDEETGKKYRVINGDTHDYRPLDKVPVGEDGVIVGLKNKKGFGTVEGAHRESKGFFVKYDPQLQRDGKGKLIRGESPGLNKAGKPLLGETIPTNKTVIIKKQ